jgi:DNA invertase Pin-like site-specific DNA recombinase
MAKLVGYTRVSTKKQSDEMQREALRKEGVAEADIHTEVASGKDRNRPVLEETLKSLQEGDTFIVWKLDRVARSVFDLSDIARDFERRRIEFKSTTEGWDTTTSQGRLLYNIIGAFAQFERDLIRERSREGLEVAWASGKRSGPKVKITDQQRRVLREMAASEYPDYTIKEMAAAIGMSTGTVCRYLKLDKAEGSTGA